MILRILAAGLALVSTAGSFAVPTVPPSKVKPVLEPPLRIMFSRTKHGYANEIRKLSGKWTCPAGVLLTLWKNLQPLPQRISLLPYLYTYATYTTHFTRHKLPATLAGLQSWRCSWPSDGHVASLGRGRGRQQVGRKPRHLVPLEGN